MEQSVRVAVLIERDSEFLLVQEAHERARGLWNWQQGKVEEGEKLEVAAVREAKEETGYDVIILRKLRVVENPFPDTKEIHVFLGNIRGGELRLPQDEIMQAKWFSSEAAAELVGHTPGPWVEETIASMQK